MKTLDISLVIIEVGVEYLDFVYNDLWVDTENAMLHQIMVAYI